MAKKRNLFRFSQADISIGATIKYRWDETITAQVYDDRHILFHDEVMTLSRAASRIRGPRKDNGPSSWTYRGESLDARKRRRENGSK